MGTVHGLKVKFQQTLAFERDVTIMKVRKTIAIVDILSLLANGNDGNNR